MSKISVQPSVKVKPADLAAVAMMSTTATAQIRRA